MNPPNKDDLLKIKLRRARKSLSEAKVLFEYNFYNASLSRLYYACFYAATALLYKKEIYTKTHSGLKQMLGLYYIKEGFLSEELGEFYTHIFYNRLKADYDELEDTDRETVKEYFLLADQFVDKVQNLLHL